MLNPISRRKDKSVKLSLETRELSPSEILTLMSMEGEEGWLMFSSNQDELKEEDLPKENSELNQKTQSQRLRAVIYRLYLQETEKKQFVGTYENFYKERMEKLITFLKGKLDEN